MNRAWFHIRLVEDAVFSKRSATVGGHEGLDHVPGSALLGSVAGKVYKDMSDQAWTIFHSGKVRFGNGLPLAGDGHRGLPMPFSLHRPKGGPVTDTAGKLQTGLVDLATGKRSAGTQWQQVRGGYVTPALAHLKPTVDMRLKSARNRDTGRSLEAALFGYTAIDRGQHFLAELQWDDDVPVEGVMEEVKKALDGKHFLGRSRTAEYSTCEVREVAYTGADLPRAPLEDKLVLLLLSDLAVCDIHGQPTLRPCAEDLGLDGVGQLDLDHSFIRTRSYSPWNRKRGGWDVERQVLEQGSVLVYACSLPDRSTIYELLEGGLGMHRENGLGQTWADPAMLKDGKVQGWTAIPLSATLEVEMTSGISRSKESEQVRSWLTSRKKLLQREVVDLKLVATWVDAYMGLVESIRVEQGKPEDALIGPSKSQWGRVLAAAKQGGPDLHVALFSDDNAACKTKAKGWKEEWYDAQSMGKKKRPLADWLKDTLTENDRMRPGIGPATVAQLANDVKRRLTR